MLKRVNYLNAVVGQLVSQVRNLSERKDNRPPNRQGCGGRNGRDDRNGRNDRGGDRSDRNHGQERRDRDDETQGEKAYANKAAPRKHRKSQKPSRPVHSSDSDDSKSDYEGQRQYAQLAKVTTKGIAQDRDADADDDESQIVDLYARVTKTASQLTDILSELQPRPVERDMDELTVPGLQHQINTLHYPDDTVAVHVTEVQRLAGTTETGEEDTDDGPPDLVLSDKDDEPLQDLPRAGGRTQQPRCYPRIQEQ